MTRRTRSLAPAMALVASLLVQGPAPAKDYPQTARGVTVPVGFVATVFAATPLVPTTLTWGPDTGGTVLPGGHRHGSLLYVGGVAGNPLSCDGCGQVLSYTDETGTPPVTAATGLNSVLGIAFGGGTMFVTDNFDNKGRVVSLKDTDADGVFETQRVLLKNIPNGRHQTNGLQMGTDGMVYVANGNATDDGIECGPALPPDNSLACPTEEIVPWTGSIIRVDPSWNNVDLRNDIRVDADPFYAADGKDDESVLVARGFRNIYDVEFRPGVDNELWTPMNGPDDPAGSEPIYGLSVDNERIVGYDADNNPIYGPIIEDAGFPSCVFDPHDNHFPEPQIDPHEHPGNPEPMETLNTEATAKFGTCESRRQGDSFLYPRTVLREGHEGTSGLAFAKPGNFPARYNGDLFIAEWGSLWNLNGASPTGHKIEVTDVNADGTISGRQREFMTTPLPIDLVFNDDGLMYVADMTGQIYQVEHVAGTDAATPDVVTVTMQEVGGACQFVPQVQTIVRGTTIRWANTCSTPQSIRAAIALKLIDPRLGEGPNQTGVEINSPGDIATGSSHSYTFGDRAGIWHYNSGEFLSPQNTMRGTIIVLPAER